MRTSAESCGGEAGRGAARGKRWVRRLQTVEMVPWLAFEWRGRDQRGVGGWDQCC